MAIQMYALIGAGAVFLTVLAGLGIQTWRLSSVKEDLATAQERNERLTKEIKRERELQKKVNEAAAEARRKAEEARRHVDKLRRENAKRSGRNLTPAGRGLYDRLQRRVRPSDPKPTPGK